MKDFKSVVFSGGGSRCMWQVGFWHSVSPELNLKPEIVAGVSAGAAMAGMIMAGTADLGLTLIKEATAANKKNFYISNFLKKEPVFPHYQIYRNTVLKTVNADVLKRFKKGPEIRVLFAHPPVYLGALSGTFVGLMAYVIEKHAFHPVHPKLATKLGYKPTVVKLNDCNSAEEIADLIMCSSCTPPFLPIMKYNGKVSLDGGIIDNVPVSVIGDDEKKGRMLVLMSRIHRADRIPRISNRIYMQPSVTPAISKWDYTNPAGLQAAYDLGKKDGDTFIKQYRNGVFKK
ncbi:MAG TPA: patatin-like phospholipase family protein [Spirochaetota bacterium]|nr:patatin-like phospholipase family protein [Spirochaetota bacterium]